MNRWKTSFKNIFLNLKKNDDEIWISETKEKRFYFSPEMKKFRKARRI